MGFKDELKQEYNHQEAEKRRLEEERKLPIPDDELNILANELANTIKENLKRCVSNKYISYDFGGFKKKKKVNFRYESRYHWLTECDSNKSYGYKFGHIIPGCKYFLESEHDMSPTTLYYYNPVHITQFFSAVKSILEKDGCIVDYHRTKSKYGHDDLRFDVYIKCTENGEII